MPFNKVLIYIEPEDEEINPFYPNGFIKEEYYIMEYDLTGDFWFIPEDGIETIFVDGIPVDVSENIEVYNMFYDIWNNPFDSRWDNYVLEFDFDPANHSYTPDYI